MIFASAAQSNDFTTKVVLLVIGAAVGFVFSLLSDRLKARRDPKKRISYDLLVGATLASVPHELAEKITVLFSGAAIEGQLYEVTCRIENTGNQVIKQQFLRFSFPQGPRSWMPFLREIRPKRSASPMYHWRSLAPAIIDGSLRTSNGDKQSSSVSS